MFPKVKKYTKKKKRPLLIILLYLAIILFFIWLLVVLLLAFYFGRIEIEEEPLLNRVFSISELEKNELEVLSNLPDSLDEKNEPKIRLDQPDRDEFKPIMKDLLKDRSFDRESFDAVFENMKSPKIIPKDSFHSTFGKDVIYIYHSHSRESFLPYFKETDKPKDAYHSKANITLVGEMLGKALEKRGVGTKVDSTDIVKELSLKGLDFNSSYKISGERVRSARVENKDLEIK